MITSALSAFGVFILFLAVQATVFSQFKIKNRVKTIFLMAILLVPLIEPLRRYLLSLGWDLLLPINVQIALTAVFLLTFMWFAYLQCYFLIERGVSARIMTHIQDSPEGLNESDIEALYSFKDVVRRRVLDMVVGGYLQKTDDASNTGEALYSNTPRGTRVAKIGSFFKRTFQLGTGG